MVFNANGQHIPVENSPLRQLGKADEINSILEAQDIKHGEDFSVEPVAKEHQNHLYDQFKVEFECFGQERYYAFSDEEREALEDFGGLDTFTVTISSDWVYSDGSNYKHGYWYLDKNGQCTVTYVNDVDPTIGFTPEETTVTLGVPGYIKRSISRDASIYSGDPFSAAYYETPTRLEWRVRPPDAFNPIYPTMPYNKEWGPGGKFPSITHADGTCRMNTVSPEQEDYYALLQEYERLTGVPILLNTSLNDNGKPIANSLCDALGIYYKSDLDVLVHGDTVKVKSL